MSIIQQMPQGPSRRRLAGNRRGQALPLMAVSIMAIFGLTGLVFDVGFINVYQKKLNAATQAAAFAGAYAMNQNGATTTTVTTAVQNFGADITKGTHLNSGTNLPSVTLNAPVFSCLNTVKNTFGVACTGPSSSNALVVTQTMSVPLTFARLFGFSTANLSATATAAMRGGNLAGTAAAPYSVAFVLDGTQSMNTTDSNCGDSRLNCALGGFQQMLLSLDPCSTSLATCGTVTSGNVVSPLDRVALFSFPPVTTATVAQDSNCGTTNPTTSAYATPFPSTSTYQIVGFSSDYRASDTATILSTTSPLVTASSFTGTTTNPNNGAPNCTGMSAVGVYGSYLAQAITQTQATLAAQKTSYPAITPIMLILSDGDYGTTEANLPGSSKTSGTYISSVQQCAQAVTAAKAATTAGTIVVSIAYGALLSGCSTDTNPTITPCQTMTNMATSAAYFFSDNANGCTSSANSGLTGLKNIFRSISGLLTVPKIIPNGTT